MAWLRISVAPPESLREDCEQVLFSCGASSVSLESAGNDEVIEPSPGETPVWRDTRLVALFPEDTQTELVAARLTETLGKKPALKARLLEDRVWERVWLDDFKPTHIAESLWVSPKHAPVDEPGAVVIRMDPGLAFGSGTQQRPIPRPKAREGRKPQADVVQTEARNVEVGVAFGMPLEREIEVLRLILIEDDDRPGVDEGASQPCYSFGCYFNFYPASLVLAGIAKQD